MVTKEELGEKIQRLKEEYASKSITKEEYQKRILEIKRDLELLKRETYEGPRKSSNKKLLVIPLVIILIVPVSYFLLKDTLTKEDTDEDIMFSKMRKSRGRLYRVIHREQEQFMVRYQIM